MLQDQILQFNQFSLRENRKPSILSHISLKKFTSLILDKYHERY